MKVLNSVYKAGEKKASLCRYYALLFELIRYIPI